MKAQYDRKGALTLTIDEAAAQLGISKYLAWELVRKGQLRSVKLGDLRRIPRTALTELLEANDGNTERSG